MTYMDLIPAPDLELTWRNPLVLTLDGVFSPAECGGLIERIERHGPTPAPVSTPRGPVMRPDLRTNDRVMFDDAALAEVLFRRVQPGFRPGWKGTGPSLAPTSACAATGTGPARPSRRTSMGRFTGPRTR
jgi:hypothetical protein